MKKTIQAAKTMLLTMAVTVMFAPPAVAQNAEITGKWDLTIVNSQGTPPAVLVLKKDGDKIVGTISGPQGDVPVEATVKEKAVTIVFTFQGQNGAVPVTMSGTADADAMKGVVDFGGRGQAEWFAQRTGAPPADAPPPAAAPAPRIDVTGAWAINVMTEAGSGTPTVVLKQDGEKLTGQYSGQLGEAPVTGTIKGSAIEFSIDVSLQGTTIHVAYGGVADSISMKGTVKLGDLGEGTFTGNKK